MLDGWRGAPPADRKAAAKGIAAVSRFIADFADEILEVEINPFAVFAEGEGCLALDAVIVAKARRIRDGLADSSSSTAPC